MARALALLFAVFLLGLTVVAANLMMAEYPSVLGPLASRLTAFPSSPVDPDDTSTLVFTVEPGWSGARIGAELEKLGLIHSALAFRLAVGQQGVGDHLAAGDYELSRSMSTEEIVTVLARGQVKRGIVATIPEGWRATQIADKLHALGFADRDEFLRAVANPGAVPAVELLGYRPPSLEGYLFPETYEVRERVSGTRAAEMMVRMYLKRVGGVLERAAAETGLSAHELLVLASIVEREAQQAAERPTIASVYLNRIATGMPLQADPTVQYAVANRDGGRAAEYDYWKGQLTTADLQQDSPFNTYVRQGLPPTPICNPGLASIAAVVQPAKTEYYYFVATGDGSHVFSRTLEEHNLNVAKMAR